MRLRHYGFIWNASFFIHLIFQKLANCSVNFILSYCTKGGLIYYVMRREWDAQFPVHRSLLYVFKHRNQQRIGYYKSKIIQLEWALWALFLSYPNCNNLVIDHLSLFCTDDSLDRMTFFCTILSALHTVLQLLCKSTTLGSQVILCILFLCIGVIVSVIGMLFIQHRPSLFSVSSLLPK